MKIYSVGGSVRDELLGLPVKDRDYVVVGASPEEMVRLGYKPVGRDFPVFLHPKTHEEYALARTERKVARGYRGFEISAAPDVTLEQDLARRDLTINAIAKDGRGGIIDPHHGAADLKAGVLRHVSPAFAEDPVRILRVARFAARFGFAVAPETRALMRSMVEAGEADALVAERVWQEVASGLMEQHPSRMFMALRECGALNRVMPEIDALLASGGEEALRALDVAAQAGATLEVRYAVLARELDPLAVEALADRQRAPTACRDLALLAARHSSAIADAAALDAETLIELFNAADAWRRPGRFADLMTAALTAEPEAAASRARLEHVWQAAAAVNTGQIAQVAGKDGVIRERIDAARLEAVRRALEKRR